MEDPAHGGHHGPEVGPVQRGGKRAIRLAEIQDDRAASGREHPPHLRERRRNVGDVAQAVSDRQHVERSVAKGQAKRIGLDKLRSPPAACATGFCMARIATRVGSGAASPPRASEA